MSALRLAPQEPVGNPDRARHAASPPARHREVCGTDVALQAPNAAAAVSRDRRPRPQERRPDDLLRERISL
jgi:hypothetical protein